MHQQGIPPLPSMLLSPMLDIFTQYIFLPNQQAAPESSQISSHNQYSMQPLSTLQRSDSQYDQETTVNGQTLPSDYSDVNELQFMDKNYLSGVQTQQSLHQNFLQVNGALRLDSPGHNNETEVNNVNSSANNMLESQELHMGEFSLNADKLSVEVPNNVHNSTESITGTVSDTVLIESCVAEGHNAYAIDCQVKGFTQLILAVMKSNEKFGPLADNEARDLWRQFLPPSRMLPFGCKGIVYVVDSGFSKQRFYNPFFIVIDLRNSIDSIT
ncbi:hypothetical protein FXO38_14895 [Capsicum annuum]|nr:hypothetical protein FXO38_14895 [Capsicum annuum]KAF3683922.1 hypothetical protein FXO37_01616 [Capsicum annuum]